MDRVILHCDCNCFFASVEAALEPKLNKSAFAVCGDQESRHGIVLAKNEAAKKYGVQTGEPIWQAKQKCHSLVIVTPTYGRYEEFSKKIFGIYCRYTDLVEPFGIDECWLDVTGSRSLFGSGRSIADELRHIIKKEVGVTISAGVSYNKIFAKMGSDYKKPDATTEITRANFKELLYPLPVGDLFMVGRKSAEKLHDIGVNRIGDLLLVGEDPLFRLLGDQGKTVWRYANGFDLSPVAPFDSVRDYQSIGNGLTFKRNLISAADIRTCVFFLCDKVAARLRKHKKECRAVQVGIRDTSMNTIQRIESLPSPTDLAFVLREAVLRVILNDLAENRRPIRALTVTGIRLLDNCDVYEQPSFDDLNYYFLCAKKEALEQTEDMLRHRYGHNMLTRCSLFLNDLGLPDGRRTPKTEEKAATG